MNYGRPELGERLAADYALGLMPPRARRRFERALSGNATLAARVAGWSERLGALDAMTPEEAPPPRVWRAIEQLVGRATPVPVPRRLSVFALVWRGFAVSAAAVCAAVAIYVALNPAPLGNIVTALGERTGISRLIQSTKRAPDIGLSTIRLGVSERERPRWMRAALLLSDDALPLTTEPPQRR